MASYASTVIADGPATYHRLNETSGTVADDAGVFGTTTVFNGTYNGTGVTLGVAGAISGDYGITLNGTAGKVSVATSPINSPGTIIQAAGGSGSYTAFTIECWVKYSVTTAELFAVSFGSTSNTVPIFGIATTAASGVSPATTAGGLEGYIRSDNAGQVIKLGSVTAFNDNTWHHVVLTLDRADTAAGANGTGRLYVDGTQASSGQLPATALTLNKYMMGALGRSTDSLFWNGSIDEVATYGFALSSTRVLAHYNAKIPSNNSAITTSGSLVEVGNKLSSAASAVTFATGFSNLVQTTAKISSSAVTASSSGSLVETGSRLIGSSSAVSATGDFSTTSQKNAVQAAIVSSSFSSSLSAAKFATNIAAIAHSSSLVEAAYKVISTAVTATGVGDLVPTSYRVALNNAASTATDTFAFTSNKLSSTSSTVSALGVFEQTGEGSVNPVEEGASLLSGAIEFDFTANKLISSTAVAAAAGITTISSHKLISTSVTIAAPTSLVITTNKTASNLSSIAQASTLTASTFKSGVTTTTLTSSSSFSNSATKHSSNSASIANPTSLDVIGSKLVGGTTEYTYVTDFTNFLMRSGKRGIGTTAMADLEFTTSTSGSKIGQGADVLEAIGALTASFRSNLRPIIGYVLSYASNDINEEHRPMIGYSADRRPKVGTS